MRVSATVPLPVAPEEAWLRLLVWEDQPLWMQDADRVDVRTTAREGVGVRVGVRTRVFGVPLFTEELEVTLWDPPRRLVMAHRSVVRGTGEWRLEPAAHGTRFTWVEDLSLPAPVVGRIALLVYRPFMAHLMRRSMADLRRLLEIAA
jgi:hypothetical protein